jgi:phosphoribosyl 1,2-cyclic phosphate phosphodiesterase
MKITFLGTGTSAGIPVIGCDCAVCTSGNPKNKRRRPSLYIEAAGKHIVVDTPPDFREQALEYSISRVDAVLLTHTHADHVLGFDDIRRFNTIQECIIPTYGSEKSLSDMRRIFDYVQQEKVPGLYRPRIDFVKIDGPFDIGEIHIEPLEVMHGSLHTLGYLFSSAGRSLGYVPDCHEMSVDVINRLKGVDMMILDALRHRPHKTHLTLEESLEILRAIGARTSYVVHMCHDLEHEATQNSLPDGINVSYDGLTLEW